MSTRGQAAGGPGAPPAQGFALALLAVFFWGAQLPIAKGAMGDIDGYTITLVRYGIAVACLIAVLVWREGAASLSMAGRGRVAALAGVVGMAGSGLFVFVGLSLTRPEVAVIIIALQPAMTAIAEWVLKRRRPPPFTQACLVLAFAGVVFVVTRGGSGLYEMLRTGPRELLGDLLVFVGAAAWVAYTLLAERLQGWSSLRVSALTCLTALAAIVVAWLFALAFGAAWIPTASALGTHAWRLLFLSLLGVFASMFLWNAGARRIGSLNAMLLLNLMPVITFAFRALEGASFSPAELGGAAMVVGALVANNLYQRRGRVKGEG